MRIYDITLGIKPGMPVWPGDPPVELEAVSRMEDGAENNLSRLACSVHTGTHVDAPRHYVQDGAAIDDLSLKTLIGRAYVFHLPRVNVITAEVLGNAGIPSRTRRVLFRTRNSKQWAEGKPFSKDYVALDESGAAWLAQRGVQLVGVDSLSVGPYARSGHAVHRTLLEKGIVVVEGLNLHGVPKGRYSLTCLPLRIIGSDGAPARVILAGV